MILPIPADGFLRFLLRTAAAPEGIVQLCFDIVGHLIPACAAQCIHIHPDFGVVLPGEVEQQPFQIAGDQNVHRRTDGGVEGPVPVIDAGAEEVRQHVIAVGGTDQLVYRQAHALCVVRCQNVAKVAGGDAEVHLVPHGESAVPHQIAVGGDVVDHLGQDTAPVDGVGRGQEITPLVQLRPDSFIGEDTLNAGLSIIKVADDRPDVHVLPLLGHHLPLLHGRDAVLGVVDLNTRLGHIRKAGHGRLAGIAGGGR